MNVSMTPSQLAGSFTSAKEIDCGDWPASGKGVIDPLPVFAAWSSVTRT